MNATLKVAETVGTSDLAIATAPKPALTGSAAIRSPPSISIELLNREMSRRGGFTPALSAGRAPTKSSVPRLRAR